MSSSPTRRRAQSSFAPVVLIIDDNRDFRDSLAEIISREGYEAAGVSTAMAALDKLRWGLRPSLIMVDLKMHLMTGWDFRSEQKKDPLLADIPVVAMTAGLWRDGDEAEFSGRLSKPVSLPELRDMLTRLIPNGRDSSGGTPSAT